MALTGPNERSVVVGRPRFRFLWTVCGYASNPASLSIVLHGTYQDRIVALKESVKVKYSRPARFGLSHYVWINANP